MLKIDIIDCLEFYQVWSVDKSCNSIEGYMIDIENISVLIPNVVEIASPFRDGLEVFGCIRTVELSENLEKWTTIRQRFCNELCITSLVEILML